MRRLSSICIVRAMLLLCFFAFSAKTFSQELKPTYVPSENRWYSLIDPTRYSERNQLTQEYQLSSTCYKPFQEFYFDLCVLGYIDGSFTSPFYLNVKVDEKKYIVCILLDVKTRISLVIILSLKEQTS